MHLVSPSRVCGVQLVMPKGTPVAGKVCPSPAVPIMGLTESDGPAAKAETARKQMVARIKLIASDYSFWRRTTRAPPRRCSEANFYKKSTKPDELDYYVTMSKRA